jgi:hypothetical protein
MSRHPGAGRDPSLIDGRELNSEFFRREFHMTTWIAE